MKVPWAVREKEKLGSLSPIPVHPFPKDATEHVPAQRRYARQKYSPVDSSSEHETDPMRQENHFDDNGSFVSVWSAAGGQYGL